MGERDGAAVVCHDCKGAGKRHMHIVYEDFEQLERRDDVKRVYQTNPGICIGSGGQYELSDFGGIPYEDWLDGGSFGAGTENRQFTCPSWWYQSADYKRMPKWGECDESLGRTFSRCPHFSTKAKCWARFDSKNR
jgi:hypothetical protein